MRAPTFWHQDGLLPRLLSPLGALYGAVTAQRLKRPGVRVAAQVICCGNATAGGTGKTILALAVCELLIAQGQSPAFLTRGYGGWNRGPLRVDPSRHTAPEVGDEALLLARLAPTFVARNRAEGAAMAAGATHLILDDGLQNPDLVKDLSLLVIDGGVGFGNRRLIPAGPLREPIAAAAARSSAGVIIGEDITGAAFLLPPTLPLLRANLVSSTTFAGVRVLGFAGIGRPEKFRASLLAAGAEVIGFVPFPDHHRYAPSEIAGLRDRAARDRAQLVTTEKDLVRLEISQRADIRTLAVRLRFDPVDGLERQVLGSLLF